MQKNNSNNHYIASKKELFKRYSKVPFRIKRSIMNQIIAQSRNISLELAKPKQKITPKEFYLFVEEFGEIS
jgi:hypothetical protein